MRFVDVNASEAAEANAAAGARPAAFDFEALFQAHYPRIARAIVRVINDPGRAEELAVETFWKLWRHREAQNESAGGWLYRSAIRLALDELRRSARRAKYEPWFRPLIAPRTPHELFDASEEQGRVRAVLAGLPRIQAELLLLRHEGLSYAELASSLGLNPASIGTLLNRAQDAFRKEYVKRYGKF